MSAASNMQLGVNSSFHDGTSGDSGVELIHKRRTHTPTSKPLTVRDAPKPHHCFSTGSPMARGAPADVRHQRSYSDTPVSDSKSILEAVQKAMDSLRSELPHTGLQSPSITTEASHHVESSLSSPQKDLDGSISPSARYELDKDMLPRDSSSNVRSGHGSLLNNDPMSPLPRFGFDKATITASPFEVTRQDLGGLLNHLHGPTSLVPCFGVDEHAAPTSASMTLKEIGDGILHDLNNQISVTLPLGFGFLASIIPADSLQMIKCDLASISEAAPSSKSLAESSDQLLRSPRFATSNAVAPSMLSSFAGLLQRGPYTQLPAMRSPLGASNAYVLPQVSGPPRQSFVDTQTGYPGPHMDPNADILQNANNFPPENLRPAPQNLRYGPFQTQQAHQSRNTPLSSGRLQNASKAGSGPSWGFGAPNGVSALPSTQPRQTGTGATSFAQTIGGPPPAASLDLSEFPSLSGTSQPQYQNQSQAIWANQRAMQQTPVQRPQQQHSITSQAPQPHQQAQDQSQRTSDDMFSPSSHLPNAMDDHRYGGSGTLGQLPASRQPQTTNVDDFPPLGRNGTDENDDRRSNLMQNSGFGGFSSANAFSLQPDQAQARNALPSASSSQANNTRSSSVVDRLTSPNGIGFGASSIGRSPTEPVRQGTIGTQDHDRNSTSAAQVNQRHEHTMNSLLNNFGEMQFQSQRQSSQPQPPDYVSRTGEALGSAATPDRTTPSQMSALDEYGLMGFLATARNENPDVSGLARGQELTSLGLNLNSSEPLYPSFAGPFADAGSRPMQPDYKLPECYVVANVHRVTDKVVSFHDETLFFIFYTQPRDLLQELAAAELTNRNWRYHKEHRMWLTKDVNLGEPVQITSEKEQGNYYFWNYQTWEKVRVSNFELHYQQLAPSVSRPNF